MLYSFKLFAATIWAFLVHVAYLPRSLRYHAHKKQNPPIFIVGCGHSGTSLLLSILAVHSKIYAVPGETAFAFDYEADQARLRAMTGLFFWYLDACAIRAGKMVWAEKTPKHICTLDTLFKLKPDARVLLVIRDGRDVATSLLKRHGDLRKGIDRWVKDNRAGEAFWNRPNVYKVRYEDILADFEGTIRGVMQFLGEDYEKQLAQYYEIPKHFYAQQIVKPADENDANHNSYRNWQINQPVFDSRGRWKALSEDEKQLIKDVAGDMLIEYGYATDKNW